MQVARPTIKPVPQQGNRPRFQATTPRPQVKHTNTFRPMSRSPPPFESPSSVQHNKKLEEIFGPQAQLQQSTNINLLSRGISLLSITQLRDLLRDYSLPTGGNKNVLVNRLIIFLETFGQNQQNILTQFSAKLKRLLSIEVDEANASSPQSEETSPLPAPPVSQNLPEEVTEKLIATSPSPLYEPTELPPSLGPILVQPDNMKMLYPFSLSSQEFIPILQFTPSFSQVLLSRVVVQINGTFINLRGPSFFTDLKDYAGRQCTLQVVSVEPPSPVVAVVRWVKQVPIQHMINQISMKEPVKKVPLSPNQTINGVCPLTHKIIARPARGVNCIHPECFDMSGFICHAMKTNSWQCPVCRKPVPIDELRIDPYYFAIASGSVV